MVCLPSPQPLSRIGRGDDSFSTDPLPIRGEGALAWTRVVVVFRIKVINQGFQREISN